MYYVLNPCGGVVLCFAKNLRIGPAADGSGSTVLYTAEKREGQTMDKILVTRSSMPPFEEYVEEIRDIWDSRWLTNMGTKHQQLAASLRAYFQVENVSLFCNGHQALEAALAQFPRGGEVITTPFTYGSTTLAIARAGLTPVFCDIEEEQYTLDPEKLEALITDKTVAILPVHVYGHICRWQAIREIADRHGLKVIYDAAHAFGISENGVSAAAMGDVSMFSFHATKVFHTAEGGCLTYGDGSLKPFFTAWERFGMYDGEQSEMLGTNAKMTEFSAAMGLCNLRHLDEQIACRRQAAERYRQRLSGRDGVVLSPEQAGVVSNYAYMPVRFLPEQLGYGRDAVLAALAEREIFARKYFYPLTSSFPLVRQNYPVQETPVAQKAAEEILCLPLYADLTLEQVDRVCDVIEGL